MIPYSNILNIQDLLDASVNFDIIYNIAKKMDDYSVNLYENSHQVNGNTQLLDVVALCKTYYYSPQLNIPKNPSINIGIIDTSTLCNTLYEYDNDVSCNAIVNGFFKKPINTQFVNDIHKCDIPVYYIIKNDNYNNTVSNPKKSVNILPLNYDDNNKFDYDGRFKLDISLYNYIIKLDKVSYTSYYYKYNISNNQLIECDRLAYNIKSYKNYHDDINRYNYFDKDASRYYGILNDKDNIYIREHYANSSDTSNNLFFRPSLVTMNNIKYNSEIAIIFLGGYNALNISDAALQGYSSKNTIYIDAHSAGTSSWLDTSLYLSYREDAKSNWSIPQIVKNRVDTAYSEDFILNYGHMPSIRLNYKDASFYKIEFDVNKLKDKFYHYCTVFRYDKNGDFMKREDKIIDEYVNPYTKEMIGDF